MKNRALHSGIKQSPYRAMFGIEPRVGLSTSHLPSEVIEKLVDEDDLRIVLQEMNQENRESESSDFEGAGPSREYPSLLARKEACESLKNKLKK